MAFGSSECAGQKLAFGAMELELENQLPLRFPALLGQQVPAYSEVAERSSEGGRGAGAPAGCQVERRELLTLSDCRNQAKTPVELIDNFKDQLVALLRRCLRRYQPPDQQMSPGALIARDGRI